MIGERARRLLPVVLLSLALSLGLCGTVGAASAADHDAPGRSPVVGALTSLPGGEGVRILPGLRLHPRLVEHRQGAKVASGATGPAAALVAAGLLGVWWARRRAWTVPVAAGRSARGSRAPPVPIIVASA